jgi:hypothetical protein
MDKRRNNGGHSTKAKGADKRKNDYRRALNEAGSVEDLKKVLGKLKDEALQNNLQAIKLYLEYYLGKPHQTIEQFNTHEFLEGIDFSKLFDGGND